MRSAQPSRASSAAPGAKAECIKVVVRCRPFSEKEKAEGHSKVVEVNCKQGSIQLQKAVPPGPGSTGALSSPSSAANASGSDNVKIYTFDSVYDASSTQEEIYADIFHPLVDSVLDGYNGTVFAYGQTGTGKTFTMEGSADDPGVIPRSFTHIFSHIGRSSHKQFLVRSSYLEIYQEGIRDLLSTDVNKRLVLRERPDVGVYVEDLSSFVCKNVSEIERVLTKGRHNRSVGATNMNEHSSRSHAIFLITIEHSERDPGSGIEHIRVGKLNLVDLAGSERLMKAQTVGKRQKEGITINLSLSALSNVISALVDGRAKRHIPYRDSKLTRLLQDSLGGNARTVMVANIGPSAYNYEETLTTLRYASRAKNIKNKPRVNEDPKDTLLKEFQAEIERLRTQLEERRRLKLTASSMANAVPDQPTEMIDVEASERLQARIRAMESKMLVGGKNIVDHTNEQQRELEQRMDQLRDQRQRERAMLRQLEEQEEATQEVRETFSSLQQEVDLKRRKLRKVVKEFQSINSEIRDLHETHAEERRELERISSDLMRDLKLRYLIIDNFIPESEKTRFLRRIYYDENDEEWHFRPTSNAESSQLAEEADANQSRPGTASSLSSRPSSAYIDQRRISASFSSSLAELSHSALFLGFQVPFHVGKVDHLGLYMPERTTLDYQPSLELSSDDGDTEDGVQIEILDVDENNHIGSPLNGTANRAKTASSRRMKQPRQQFSTSSSVNWNDMAIGKTPPPMRRSLTVMNNYVDLDGDGEGDLRWASTPLDGVQTLDSTDVNSLLDLKRANVRRKLCSSLSNHAAERENLNLRPDTAFPRSRGLVPK